MSLVQYSDSDTDSDPDKSHATPSGPTKKPRQNGPVTTTTQTSSLPPLPTAFYDLYATSTRASVQDDPSLHGGRKRVIPHVEGNWPTHLYFEWFPSKSELSILENVINQAESKPKANDPMIINSLLRSELGTQLPLHISLSRPVVLRTEQRHPFLETYQTAVQSSSVAPFDITLGSLDWVSNFEKTRWFLVLHAQRPANDGLNRLLRLSNRALALFGQPPLYERTSQETSRSETAPITGRSDDYRRELDMKPSEIGAGNYSHFFHISLAWSLTGPSADDQARLADIDLRELMGYRVRFDCVKAKIGNNISSIHLPKGVFEQRGIGGL